MNGVEKNPVTLPLTQAREVLFAQVLEEVSPAWSNEDRASVSADARRLAGDKKNPADVLTLRAKLVLARCPGPDGKPHCAPPELPGAGLPTLFLSLAALCAGALSDQVASNGHRINLLAAPFLTLLLWNFAVYLGLLILPLLSERLKSKIGSFAAVAAPLFDGRWWTRIGRRDVLRTTFFSRWAACAAPAGKAAAKRALHLAAAAFVLGWVFSMVVRGIGTAYVVGWESTWFAARPDWVAAVLTVVYPIPGGAVDAIEAEALRFVPFGLETSDSAAQWMLRIITTVLLFVWLPRGMLALREHLRLNHMKVALPDELIQTISEKSDTALTLLLPQEADNAWQTAAKELPQVHVRFIDLWMKSGLDDVAAPAVLVLNAAATPEEDVHGTVLASLPPGSILLLDQDELFRRFTPESTRARSRLALWETFAAERRVRLLPVKSGIGDPVDQRRQCLERLFTS